MTTPRDPTNPRNADQLIHAFLDEGPTDLREQVFDEVRTEIDRTEQRTTFGPWRNPLATRFAGFVAATAVIAVAVIFGLSLGGGGPLIGGNPSLSPSAQPSAEPTTPATESAEPSDDGSEPSEEPSASDAPPVGVEFTCDTAYSVESTDTGFAPLQLTDVRIGEHEGFDRVVFEYDANVVPALSVRFAVPPFVHDPSGLPLEVDGAPVYLVNIVGASKYDAEGNLVYTGSTDIKPGLPQIVQLVESGDFEAVNNWYLGVNGGDCLRVFPLADPGRLVIDVQHLD